MTDEALKPCRVQLRRTKGWRMPPNTVKVDRTTPWGNDYQVGPIYTRERAVLNFTKFSIGRGQFAKRKIRKELAGKNLACWCPLDQPCHADVLLRIANTRAGETP